MINRLCTYSIRRNGRMRDCIRREGHTGGHIYRDSLETMTVPIREVNG